MDEEAAAYITKAREIWVSDELEIDDDPRVSFNGEGCWVRAWVYVSEDAIEEIGGARPDSIDQFIDDSEIKGHLGGG